jgi:hypothetical protein
MRKIEALRRRMRITAHIFRALTRIAEHRGGRYVDADAGSPEGQ